MEQNTRLNDQWLESIIETFRAYLYRRQGYLKAAEQSYKKALQNFLNLGDNYHVAETYLWIGGIELEIATKDLEEAIDMSGKARAGLINAERYFNQSESQLKGMVVDLENQFVIVSCHVRKGVIARIRGELNQARNLFQSCIGKYPALLSVARLYRELALVEHLTGNKELAYSYEEKGINFFRQVEVVDKLTPHNCYRVIDRMKREGTW